jgi:hypothetical protein
MLADRDNFFWTNDLWLDPRICTCLVDPICNRELVIYLSPDSMYQEISCIRMGLGRAIHPSRVVLAILHRGKTLSNQRWGSLGNLIGIHITVDIFSIAGHSGFAAKLRLEIVQRGAE